MDEPDGIHGQDDDDTETETPQRRAQPVAATAGRGGVIRGSLYVKIPKRATLLKLNCSVTCDDHAPIWSQRRFYRVATTG